MKSRNKSLDHDPVRRAAIVAVTYVGLQAAASSGFATSVLPPYTFEQMIARSDSIVIAKIHRFLVSGMDALDDFKPAAEVKDPMRVVFDITIKRVLAISPKVGGVPPVEGRALVFLGGGATEYGLSLTPYPAAIGKEVILLLRGRRRSTSKDTRQPPIYQTVDGLTSVDQAPLSLDRLNDVLIAAFKAGFKQPDQKAILTSELIMNAIPDGSNLL